MVVFMTHQIETVHPDRPSVVLATRPSVASAMITVDCPAAGPVR
jgi:hypothetical protein